MNESAIEQHRSGGCDRSINGYKKQIKNFQTQVCNGSFRVKSPNFQEIPHDPSQMFPEKITKNSSMCSNDTYKILDADHY